MQSEINTNKLISGEIYIEVKGDLISSESENLKNQILKSKKSGIHLTLNLESINSIDVTAIQLIYKLIHEKTESGFNVSIIPPKQENILITLRNAGLLNILTHSH